MTNSPSMALFKANKLVSAKNKYALLLQTKPKTLLSSAPLNSILMSLWTSWHLNSDKKDGM